MDFKRSFKALAIIMMGVVSFTGCEDEDEEPEAVTNSGNSAWVLNQGTMGSNNASVSLIDFTKEESYYHQFYASNDRNLGDVGQDAIRYGGKIYISVYASNTIEVVDGQTLKSLKTIQPEAGNPGSPRYLAADGANVYVSLYDGYVAKIDTASLSIVDSVAVGPNPEQLTIANGNIYVAISDGMNYNAGYVNGLRVAKVSLDSFKVASNIGVMLNPTQITSDKDGNVFVLSMGNYGDVPATVQMIDKNDSVKVLTQATIISCYENTLYTINAPWGASSIDFSSVDTKTGNITKNIIKGSADELPANPTAISVNPKNGNIMVSSYLTASDYASNGYVFEYTSDGAFKAKYNVGVGPTKIIY